MIEEGGVSMFSFLKLNLLEFRGDRGTDLVDFLEEVEKVVRRLPCSDLRAVELVGLLLKGKAWAWFSWRMEPRLYAEHPPAWAEFH